jgi:hypothetical protein
MSPLYENINILHNLGCTEKSSYGPSRGTHPKRKKEIKYLLCRCFEKSTNSEIVDVKVNTDRPMCEM